MQKSLLYGGFGVLVALGTFDFLGRVFYFYWDVRWFDSLAHFLGGLAMGLIFLWVWFVSGLFGRSTPSKREAFVTSILAAMIIGLGWEFFEYAHGIANPVGGNYPLDTFHDLLADFWGGAVAGFVGRNHKRYE